MATVHEITGISGVFKNKMRFWYGWQNEGEVEHKVLRSQEYVGLVSCLKYLVEEEMRGIKSNKQPARIANMMFYCKENSMTESYR